MITTAVQRGSYVYVYGEGNRQLFSRYGELAGYTSGTVSVKNGNYIYTYDANGYHISSHHI